MLSDGKIDSLDTHLEQFKLNEDNRQTDLQNLLREYGTLLEDYKVLKKAFEVKANKSTVVLPHRTPSHSGKAREPYVLVLVDGNDYIFNDELIKDKEEGGMRAARLLNEAVEKYLHHSVPATRKAHIIVRIYADLTALSKQLTKSKVTGPEKRSLAPFSAAFTRAIGLFDYIDALDEEGTKFKVREQFKYASEDDACSHIIFAACHDPAYLSQLVPFSGMREKITLVQGAGWNQEFDQFNLNVTQFPTAFRWSEVPTIAPINRAVSSSTVADPTPYKSIVVSTRPTLRTNSWRRDGPVNGNRSALSSPELAPVRPDSSNNGVSLKKEPPTTQEKTKVPCKHFQKGTCRFGDKCTFAHVPLRKPSSQIAAPSSDRTNIATHLPKKLTPGFIPINASNQRLDAYIRPPTDQEFSIYNARFHQRKPCNTFHLQQSCTNFDCAYDHSALEPQSRHVLSYVLRCTACPRKGECRVEDCFYGHVCQKEGCSGQMKGLHDVDPRVAGMVPAEGRERKKNIVQVEEVRLVDVEEQSVESKEPVFYW
ncbi:hypothetical protein T440DRAFT_451600 [Plenodomus tracheiphilus IPT5]|uniref:C3H1-type domain-containing protein n=1 Tax=Plenodomus tracheiphilus IPT5 TaxID=1408161 RepID=A0A6A7B3U9_9PLEO|nr:hypothetical protein T440DRAFT_451600 [Plenodomus tracheiphilus IPT5]